MATLLHSELDAISTLFWQLLPLFENAIPILFLIQFVMLETFKKKNSTAYIRVSAEKR